MGIAQKQLCNTVEIEAEPSIIWDAITNVKIEHCKFPWFLSILGVPKPLSAEVIKEGVDGFRVANFSNGAQFKQNILEWEINKKYRFKFNATKNFKVGYFLNLSRGPFEILTGGYDLNQTNGKTELSLSSTYKTNGLLGRTMNLFFRLVVYQFQIYLLKGIKNNCENRKV